MRRLPVRPTRRFAVSSAAWCAPSIDLKWSAPIGSPRPGLRSSLRITSRCSTASSSGPRSRELRFIAKAELWRSRLLAWALDGLGAIPIERNHGDYLTAARVLQALAAEQAVVIFPQGAVRGDRVWRRGAAHMALVTGAPLVPVRLVGTARALSLAKSDSRACASSSESRSKSARRRQR